MSTTTCGSCGAPFDAPSSGGGYDERFPNLAFDILCWDCLDAAAHGHSITDVDFTPDRLLDQIRRLDHLVGRLPLHHGWRKEIFHRELTPAQLAEAVAIAGDIPRADTIGLEVGGWVVALQDAGVLEPEARANMFGIESLAADGHHCHSLGEVLIDDWLSLNEVPHEREPLYPGGRFRGDFRVDDVMIEYLGLHGMVHYDRKTTEKREVARAHGLGVIELTPADIENWDETARLLADLLDIDDVRVLPSAPRRTAPAPTTPYVRDADRRAAAYPEPLAHTREPGWYPDPFGAAEQRRHDGRSWTRHIRLADGHEAVHTPTVSLDVAHRIWEAMDSGGDLFGLAEPLYPGGKPPPLNRNKWREFPDGLDEVPPALLELLLAWMDAGENHVVKLTAEIRAAGDELWGPLRIWPTPYREAANLFRAAQLYDAELAIHLRERDARPGRPHSTRLGQLFRRGHGPDDVAAGLVVLDR